MHQDMQQICLISEIRITCLVKEEDVEKSVKSLHSMFELDKD